MFSFSSEILCCVSGYQMKAYNIFTFLKIKLFLANKGNLLLKLKHVGHVVWSFIKKNCFHNFSSSVMYILLNKYFCCTVFKKADFYFDGLPWIPLHVCVYMIWGYEPLLPRINWWNAHEVALRAVLEMLIVCLCPHWDVTCFSVCVLKENARLCLPFIQRYDRV